MKKRKKDKDENGKDNGSNDDDAEGDKSGTLVMLDATWRMEHSRLHDLTSPRS